MQPKLKSMALAVLGVGLLTSLATAQGCLTTTFASNNGGSTGWCNYFDVNVKNVKGLKITSMDINSSATANSTAAIDVYVTPNTYVGKDSNPALWTKVASGSGTAKGRNTPTPINISDFFLAPGKHGMCIHYTSGGMGYTNGTATNNKYSNADLVLTLGIARGAPWGGTLFNP
ncbi:MAG: hypothetical protein ACYTGO_14845, partial [Planctomycetota bacterium]